jgi:hypothetical protein
MLVLVLVFPIYPDVKSHDVVYHLNPAIRIEEYR